MASSRFAVPEARAQSSTYIWFLICGARSGGARISDPSTGSPRQLVVLDEEGEFSRELKRPGRAKACMPATPDFELEIEKHGARDCVGDTHTTVAYASS